MLFLLEKCDISPPLPAPPRHGMFKHSRESKGPGHQMPPSSAQPPSAQRTPGGHGGLSAASAVSPSHAGWVCPALQTPLQSQSLRSLMTRRKAFSQLEGVSPSVVRCVLTRRIHWKMPRNVVDQCQTGGKSENWEGRSGKPLCPGQH